MNTSSALSLHVNVKSLTPTIMLVETFCLRQYFVPKVNDKAIKTRVSKPVWLGIFGTHHFCRHWPGLRRVRKLQGQQGYGDHKEQDVTTEKKTKISVLEQDVTTEKIDKKFKKMMLLLK